MTPPRHPLQSHPAALGSDQAEMLLDTVLSRAPVGFAFIDSELRYVRVNAHFAAVNGVPVEAHLGRTVREVVPDIATAVEPLLRRGREAGETRLGLGGGGGGPAAPPGPPTRGGRAFSVPGPEASTHARA